MKKIILALFLSASLYSAESGIDYRGGGLLRSYALGAAAWFDIGYGQKIWDGGSEYIYGYIRPSTFVITSAIINTVGAQLDFYPISFLGFEGGYSYTYRGDTDVLSGVDCDNFFCGGNIERQYIGAKLTLGVGSFFVTGRAREYRTTLKKGSDRDFIDELSNTVARAGNDNRVEIDAATGIRLTKNDNLGVSYRHHKMQYSDSDTTYIIMFYQTKRKPWKFLVGGGHFTSESGSTHPTVLSTITWEPVDGIGI